MKAQNTITTNQPIEKRNLSTFIGFMNSDTTQKLLLKSVGGDQRSLARFCATVKSAVMGNEKLQSCDSGSIMNAALHGEIALDLSYALGQYALVPYGDICTFQIQTKGLEQLCIRSGMYSSIRCIEVHEGELNGYDDDWLPVVHRLDDATRNERPIIGYCAKYRLNEQANKMQNSVYMTREECLKHAEHYACGRKFDRSKFDRIERGEEQYVPKKDSPWYDVYGGGFDSMCKKTVMKKLLNSGIAPKAVIDAISADNAQEQSGEANIYPDTPSFTGETVPEQKEDVIPKTDSNGDVIDAEYEEVTGKETADEDDSEAVKNFFGE